MVQISQKVMGGLSTNFDFSQEPPNINPNIVKIQFFVDLPAVVAISGKTQIASCRAENSA